MKIDILSFTARGHALAERIHTAFTEHPPKLSNGAPRLTMTVARCNEPLSLSEWTTQMFDQSDALVFVGAAGIAGGAIAPLVKG